MGVPLLLTWLRKRFASCFIPANSDRSDHIRHADNLYVDLNSFLYQAASIVENRYQRANALHGANSFDEGDEEERAFYASSSNMTTEEIESLVLDYLYQLLDDVILRVVQPTCLVYLAVDGVSPLGKLAQQRSRRHRRAVKSPPSFSSRFGLGRGGGDSRGSGFTASQWDSNCISVGTKFMHKAALALHQYAVMRTESINLQRLEEGRENMQVGTSLLPQSSSCKTPIVFVVDDVFRPGEGETKISEAIRRFRVSPSYYPNASHVICSTDTDVTVTSLLLHDPHIHVLRYEPPTWLSGSSPGTRGGGGGRNRVGRGGRGRGDGGCRGALHGNVPHFSSSRGAQPSRGGPTVTTPSDAFSFSSSSAEPWSSTFFSIHHFREALREVLRLAPPSLIPRPPPGVDGNERKEETHPGGAPSWHDAAPYSYGTLDSMAAESTEFEKALHDIVFLLLLFGNDFLPSVSGSIQEGTLDALLTLLSEDFVPRKRYIVDSKTNHINFDAARYLLSRLLELRQGRLEIYTSTPFFPSEKEHTMPASMDLSPKGSTYPTTTMPTSLEKDSHSSHGRGDTLEDGNGGGVRHQKRIPESWGVEDDSAFQQRRQERERGMRKRCYCYWTMLQWALHYSAGEVKHWGCYYPYSTAPPLDKLSEYCGVISYPQLRKFAERQASHAVSLPRSDKDFPYVSTEGRVEGAAGPERDDDDDDDEVDLADQRSPTTTPGSYSSVVVTRNEEEEDRGEPTDVLVQLLVLLPPQSAALLPTWFQQHYGEIEKMVNAPMERIDFNAVLSWCNAKEKMLSESDQTRFRAYRFFSHSSPLHVSSLHKGPATSSLEGSPGAPPSSIPTLTLRSRDILFMASWNLHTLPRVPGDALGKRVACLESKDHSAVQPTTEVPLPIASQQAGGGSAEGTLASSSPASFFKKEEEEKEPKISETEGGSSPTNDTREGKARTSSSVAILRGESLKQKWASGVWRGRGGGAGSTFSAAAAAVKNSTLLAVGTTPSTASPDDEAHGLSERLSSASQAGTKNNPEIEKKEEMETPKQPLIPSTSHEPFSNPSCSIVVREHPSFAFRVGPLTLLGDERLQQSMGEMDGNCFLLPDFHCSPSFSTSFRSSARKESTERFFWGGGGEGSTGGRRGASVRLSRDGDTHLPRLCWELAATIEYPEEHTQLPRLLPGVQVPPCFPAILMPEGEKEAKKHTVERGEGTAGVQGDHEGKEGLQQDVAKKREREQNTEKEGTGYRMEFSAAPGSDGSSLDRSKECSCSLESKQGEKEKGEVSVEGDVRRGKTNLLEKEEEEVKRREKIMEQDERREALRRRLELLKKQKKED